MKDITKNTIEKDKQDNVSTEDTIFNTLEDDLGITPGFFASYTRHKIEEYLRSTKGK